MIIHLGSALSFTKSTGLLQYLGTASYLLSNSVIISSKKDDTDISLSFYLAQAFGTAKGFVYFITK